jgi:ribonuclease J
LFASNVHRLIALGRIAERTGRKVCLLGRSLRSHHEVATAVGRLSWPSNLLVSPEQAAVIPGKELLVLSGGTQAEPHAAMRRLASDQHPLIRLRDTDRVIFSSRIIPGNERAVTAMHNDLLRHGVDLRTWRNQPRVHTSGHGGRSEQRRMLELIRPTLFIPVHGTLHHLREHAKLASEVGVAQTLVVENGRTVLATRDALEPDAWVQFGKIPVTEQGIEIPEAVLRERSQLGRSGVLVIGVAWNTGARSSVDLLQLGIAGLGDDAELRRLKAELHRTLRHARSADGLHAAIRRTARAFLKELDIDRCRIEVMIMEG